MSTAVTTELSETCISSIIFKYDCCLPEAFICYATEELLYAFNQQQSFVPTSICAARWQCTQTTEHVTQGFRQATG